MAYKGIEVESGAYTRMKEGWRLLEDLIGGTRAMRAAGELWLPKETLEQPLQYQRRLYRSILYGAFGDTVDRFASKPFRNPVTIKGTLPENLVGMEKDVDRSGRSLSDFARDLMRDAVVHGKTHFLVDFPQTGGGQTRADEAKGAIRPYFVHLKASDIFAWRGKTNASGEDEMSQIRIRQKFYEPDGDYKDKEYDQITVHKAADGGAFTTQIFQMDSKKTGWVPTGDEYISTFTGGIPLVTIYFLRDGVMTARPPLEDLAWLNLAHWQSYSDQRNILRYARLPVIWARGNFTDEMGLPIDIKFGPGCVVRSMDQNSDIKYVEHSGKAIEAGRQDVDDIEERMTILGLRPQTTGSKSGGATATGRVIDETNTFSDLQAWIRALEVGIEQGYKHAATWVGQELPEDFGADVYNDFGVSMRAADDIRSLIDTRRAKEITSVTFLQELKRRGLLADDIDVEKEAEDVKKEGPPLGALTGMFKRGAGGNPMPGDAATGA